MIDRIPLPLLEDILANRCLPIIKYEYSQNGESLDGIMPNWNEVGNEFAKKLGWNPSVHKDPLYVISYYSHEYSKTSTIENLKSILHIDTVKPGVVHHAFAKLPFDTIVATNYDYLLETAYKNVGRKHIVIADENQFSTAKINFASNESTLILKIHSDFGHPDKMVITEADGLIEYLGEKFVVSLMMKPKEY